MERHALRLIRHDPLEVSHGKAAVTQETFKDLFCFERYDRLCQARTALGILVRRPTIATDVGRAKPWPQRMSGKPVTVELASTFSKDWILYYLSSSSLLYSALALPFLFLSPHFVFLTPTLSAVE